VPVTVDVATHGPAASAPSDAGTTPSAPALDDPSDPAPSGGTMRAEEGDEAVGDSLGRLRGGWHVSPSVGADAPQVTGGLPRKVIERIVRQNLGRFRLCYDAALRAMPMLKGRVWIKFVIDGSGTVASAADVGSSLSDKAMVACVKEAFTKLAFPQPQGQGTVTVVYPITFKPE